jgi:hypothetical protein
MHLSDRRSHSSKTVSSSSREIPLSTAIASCKKLVIGKCCTHQRHFQFAEHVKSNGAKSGEKAGYGGRVNRFALR